MYNKEELLSKSISELEDIAKELNVTIKSGASMEDIVYATGCIPSTERTARIST